MSIFPASRHTQTCNNLSKGHTIRFPVSIPKWLAKKKTPKTKKMPPKILPLNGKQTCEKKISPTEIVKKRHKLPPKLRSKNEITKKKKKNSNPLWKSHGAFLNRYCLENLCYYKRKFVFFSC